MRYSKKIVPITTRHRISHEEFHCDQVEALVAVRTGLAIAPINDDLSPGATFATCSQWVLMHLESGLFLGEPFPASEVFAKAYLEEVNTIAEVHLSRSALDESPLKKQALLEQIKKVRQQIENQYSYRQEPLFL